MRSSNDLSITLRRDAPPGSIGRPQSDTLTIDSLENGTKPLPSLISPSDIRILYEGTIFSRHLGQPFGGISRYFQKLFELMPEDVSPLVTLRGATPVNFRPRRNMRSIQLKMDHLRPWRVFSKLDKWLCKNHPSLIRADLDHPTYYTGLDGEAVQRGRRPLVITVYDMIHELFAQDFPGSEGFVRDKRRAIESADVVICISERTRTDLLDLINIPQERVRVIHLAADPPRQKEQPRLAAGHEPFFLYVGQRRMRYKNFPAVLQAFSRLATDRNHIRLMVAGPQWDADELELLKSLPCMNRVDLAVEPDDDRLAELYETCTAFVYPSLYEGFGIPPLEAMQAGAAVICSNRGSLPEVVGQAAMLFDPGEKDDLFCKMRALIDSPESRNALVKLGLAQAGKYSWEETVQKTHTVYRDVL